MYDPIDRIVHTMAFVTPVVEHWLEQDCKKNPERTAYNKVATGVTDSLKIYLVF